MRILQMLARNLEDLLVRGHFDSSKITTLHFVINFASLFIYRCFNDHKKTWRPMRLFPNQLRMANYRKEGEEGWV